MRASHLIATFGGVGLLRPAPGTWGSLAALPVAWLLLVLGGLPLLLIGIFLAIASGIWATQVETKGKSDKDPGEIVIDEVAGQWIALLPVAVGAAHAGAAWLALWPGWIAAFVLFRLFDIWKPGPVGWADRRGGATGVMLDDVIAGLFAALCTGVLGALWHAIA
ncbi:phosphatidylglycerophosphatase A [Roseovarius sp. SCSIO 43702]|uniref:phosphatidylglycerophosphatase A family protein n=1 Tax=Roseovarius sp. SCSIO 43702 TaxID=2823043 RepID=UPI001C72EC3B|nr:phosphatidylglycerophosphatase A [Roseovarius sp. SCSIO 43702]QYX55497.1 phosphatidylglycerophosphatase A [Roseovarius sp. SCSIO 43702]